MNILLYIHTQINETKQNQYEKYSYIQTSDTIAHTHTYAPSHASILTNSRIHTYVYICVYTFSLHISVCIN